MCEDYGCLMFASTRPYGLKSKVWFSDDGWEMCLSWIYFQGAFIDRYYFSFYPSLWNEFSLKPFKLDTFQRIWKQSLKCALSLLKMSNGSFTEFATWLVFLFYQSFSLYILSILGFTTFLNMMLLFIYVFIFFSLLPRKCKSRFNLEHLCHFY